MTERDDYFKKICNNDEYREKLRGEIKALIDIHSKSTQVDKWHPNLEEGRVVGPHGRSFMCGGGSAMKVAQLDADIMYAAAAMTYLPNIMSLLLYLLDDVEKRKLDLAMQGILTGKIDE